MFESRRPVTICTSTSHAVHASEAPNTMHAIRRAHSLRYSRATPSAGSIAPALKKTCSASGSPRNPVNGGSRIVNCDSAETYAHCTSGLAIRNDASSVRPRLRAAGSAVSGIRPRSS